MEPFQLRLILLLRRFVKERPPLTVHCAHCSVVFCVFDYSLHQRVARDCQGGKQSQSEIGIIIAYCERMKRQWLW